MTSTIQAPPAAPKPKATPGLPPTGLQQQLSSMQEQYQRYSQARIPGLGSIGVDVNAGGAGNQQSLRSGATGAQAGQAMQAGLQGQPGMPQGQTSLQALAQRLASSYGLAVGRDNLVDAQGNFMMTPDQIAKASGGADTMGTAAAKMNYIASAIQKQQTQQNMNKSEAALQAGLGVVSKRGRGSAVEQQQQFYQGLANLYQNQDYEAADFSYFIQKEKQDIESEMMRKAEKLSKSKAKAGFWGGLAMTGINIAAGNYAGAVQSGMSAYGSGAEAGYF